MPLYKFAKNEVYINRVRTYPQLNYVIYSGSSYYNNTPDISGSFTGSIRMTSPGHISLYELNIDRASGSGPSPTSPATSGSAFISIFEDNPDPTVPGYTDAAGVSDINVARSVANNGLIYPFVIKDGTRIAFRTTTSDQFNSFAVGDVIAGSYPLTASITKNYYAAGDRRFQPAIIDIVTPANNYSGFVTRLMAMANTMNTKTRLSPHYSVSLPTRDLTASTFTGPDYPNPGPGTACDVGLLSIPSMFYGSEIKKGTVDLQFYFTGTLIARAQDTRQNGELVETHGPKVGSVVGVVLYPEGLIVLTGSYDLGSTQDGYTTNSWLGSEVLDEPKWVYFGQSLSGSVKAEKSLFQLNASGTTLTPTMTMFMTAEKGELNHSNNPSYTTYMEGFSVESGLKGYFENSTIPIKNVVSSSFAEPTGSFEKTTYISKIGIFDENKNLIGIAKMATPIKKTPERNFTFKVKLDL